MVSSGATTMVPLMCGICCAFVLFWVEGGVRVVLCGGRHEGACLQYCSGSCGVALFATTMIRVLAVGGAL